MIADNIDQDPEFVEKLCDQCRDLSHETVHRFEQIGRKQLYPQLLLNDSPGVRRLRCLPYELQKLYSTKPVSMLLDRGDTMEIDIRNMSPDQASQTFARDHVRTIAEQRAWIEQRKAVAEVVAENQESPYQIVGRSVVLKRTCRLTTADLAKILAEIEEKNSR
jgi:hypothetical protein